MAAAPWSLYRAVTAVRNRHAAALPVVVPVVIVVVVVVVAATARPVFRRPSPVVVLVRLLVWLFVFFFFFLLVFCRTPARYLVLTVCDIIILLSGAAVVFYLKAPCVSSGARVSSKPFRIIITAVVRPQFSHGVDIAET